MAAPDFDDRVLALCDDLWREEARTEASMLYLGAFTGFGTERAYETLNALRGVRAHRVLVDRLDLSAWLNPLISELADALEPLGMPQPRRPDHE